MSSKRRNIVAWVLVVLASLSWFWGKVLVNSDSYGVEETIYPHATSMAVTYPTEWSREPTVEWDYEIKPMPVGTSAPDLMPFLGYFLCFAAAIMAGIALLALRQKTPGLGPEVWCLLWGLFLEVALREPALLSMPYATPSAFAYILGYTLKGALLLETVRELLGWVLAKCDIRWLALWRLGAKLSGKGRLLLWSLWPVVPLLIAGWMLRSWELRYGWYFYLLMLGAVAATPACLWRFGKDAEHLRRQIGMMAEDVPVEPGNGSFRKEENALLELQQAQQEAIRTAVTAERFRVDLIANVSHDLRTPLTSILGYAELLEQESLSPEGREQLAQLNRKAGYMRELVDSLFELTKVSSGVTQAKTEELDLIKLLEQTLGLFDDKLTAAGLRVCRKYCSQSLPVVTDGARMHQVFANLVGNAIKYALTGTRLHLEVREEADTVSVRLVNTASYEMDFDEQEILQRFARGDKARTTQGSGIGLAIAQSYTESVGGQFRIVIDGDQFSAIVTLPKPEE